MKTAIHALHSLENQINIMSFTTSHPNCTHRGGFAGLLILTGTILLGACSDSETPVSAERTGIFLDSAVQGLEYSTLSRTGITDATGAFSYLAGENITFSIGDLILPTVRASSIVTPLDIFEASSSRDAPVTNLARLLQSLDADGDTSNGIQIDPVAAASASMIDFFSDDFDQQVVNLIANSGSINTTLIDSSTAIAHLDSTLDQEGLSGSGCTSEHPLVGQQQEFQTRFHDVSGTAQIIDDCTIQISNFNYDGQGPKVYFFGALDGRYGGSDAFIIGEDLLNGTVFANDQLTLTLPAGITLDDFSGISVWCAEFDINFGSAEFNLPPG